jgi:hypothetical protein
LPTSQWEVPTFSGRHPQDLKGIFVETTCPFSQNKMSKVMIFKSHKKKILIGASLILGQLYIAFGIMEPQTLIGRSIFYAGYLFPPTRPQHLQFYRWSIQSFDNGYPMENDFLLKQLSSSRGSAEETGIVDFYIGIEASRWREELIHANDEQKKQIIGSIINRLDKIPVASVENALLLVEMLRRNELIGKGGFMGKDKDLKTLADAYRKWWRDGSTWPANKNQNPLAGIDIKVKDFY